MNENIKLSLHGIWSHKMRSILTMLGIIIGIASIIAIVSTIKGNSELIKSSLIGSNTNVVTVSLYQGSETYDMEYSELPQGVLPIEAEKRAELEELDKVEKVSFYRQRSYTDGTVFYKGSAYSGALLGVDDQYLSVYGYHLQEGRAFIGSDFEKYRKTAVLDSTAASSLFNNADPVGEVLEIAGEPFTIIGVVEQNAAEVNIENLDDYYTYAEDSSGKIFIGEELWPMVYRFDEVQTIAVKATSTDDMTTAGKNVEDAINEAYNMTTTSTYYFKSQDLLEQAQQLQEMSNATNRQLIWIAGISLLVGGIGVMNIMLVTVTERTKEIGLKKALGAKKRRILAQFLTEAAVLTSIGGILGVIIGVIVANILSKIMGIPVAISIPAMLIAVVFSMFIGILFGFLPARKAANLNPIDALRTE